MKYYDQNTIREILKGILSATYPCQVGNDTWHTAEDRLYQLISTITETAYGAGMREVQQGVIRALDLRHLLGIR